MIKEDKLEGERKGSTGNMENIGEMWKRKREEGDRGEKEEEERWVFREGRKVQRSPQKETRERRAGEGSWWKEVKEEWKKEMKKGVKEVKEMLKKEVRELGREMREELEELRRQLREREKRWEREREGMVGRIAKLEKGVEEMRKEKVEEEIETEEGGRGEWRRD